MLARLQTLQASYGTADTLVDNGEFCAVTFPTLRPALLPPPTLCKPTLAYLTDCASARAPGVERHLRG
jgi:hypothetical protein